MATITCPRCTGRGGFDTIVPYLGIVGLCFECAGAGVVEKLPKIRCAHCKGRHHTVAEVRFCQVKGDDWLAEMANLEFEDADDAHMALIAFIGGDAF